MSEARSERFGPAAKFGHAHCMHCPSDVVLAHAAQPDGGGDAEQAEGEARVAQAKVEARSGARYGALRWPWIADVILLLNLLIIIG